MINSILKLTTIYMKVDGGIDSFKLKEPHYDIEYLFNKKKRIFFISPRQTGKTLFLVHSVLNNIGRYDQILVMTPRNMLVKDFSKRLIANFEFYDLKQHCSKYSNTNITINGTEILLTNNINDITKQNVLIIYDEFVFDMEFTKKIGKIDDLIRNGRHNIDIIGGSSKAQNANYRKVVTKDILDGNYEIYSIYFSDLHSPEKLLDIVKTYPSEILEQYI